MSQQHYRLFYYSAENSRNGKFDVLLYVEDTNGTTHVYENPLFKGLSMTRAGVVRGALNKIDKSPEIYTGTQWMFVETIPSVM